MIYCSSIEDNISLDSQDTIKYSEIKILSLNTGGLRSKVHNPEFEETIYNYDIVCIRETRFDSFDSLDMLGFKCLPLMTRTNAKIRSGGIAILVKEHLFDKIKILKNDVDNFYWFTLKDHFAYDIIFCVVYIAPEGSNYSNIDCFEKFESDILNFSTENYKLCLLGDFNSHTKEEYDFITVDSDIQHTLDKGNLDSTFNYCSIEQLGFPKERHNTDQSRIDNYGRSLFELCKSCDLYIANGRFGHDRFLGSKACKCTTVVDYVILSPSLFPFISEFEVLPFDPIISDAHSGPHFSLICSEIVLKQPYSCDQPVSVTRSTWDSAESASFIQGLDTNKIASFIDKIDALNADQVSVMAIQNYYGYSNFVIWF